MVRFKSSSEPTVDNASFLSEIGTKRNQPWVPKMGSSEFITNLFTKEKKYQVLVSRVTIFIRFAEEPSTKEINSKGNPNYYTCI